MRVFGTGFDLSQATQYQVLFSKAGGGWVSKQAISGDMEGQQEYLVVEVPAKIAESGPIRVESIQGGRDCVCTFGLLHPRLTVLRTTGLPSEVTQGCASVPVGLFGQDFPYDPFYSYGSTGSSAAIMVESRALAGGSLVTTTLGTAAFGDHGTYTATFVLNVPFPVLNGSAGGSVTVIAHDSLLPTARAAAPFAFR